MHGPLTRDSALAPASFPDLEAAYLALLRTATDESEFRIAPRSNAAVGWLGPATVLGVSATCSRARRVPIRPPSGDQVTVLVLSGWTTPPPALDPPQLWLNARAPPRGEDTAPARLTAPSDA
ncbi:hypothetical protein SAMN05216259_102462 [Actinacidiphila guanduensis]|uniref:Uncharacterized protein n=1 Tax=Actinacidiphila guanduensis TaxID=310781 RepID=A0A1G9YAW5_9ACTN|nr:hypothetical protein SAMN05216259_102462 [Actinacidiphila guanduensis]